MREKIDLKDYSRIKRIAQLASSQGSLNYTKCYSIVLMAFLVRRYGMEINEIPPEFRKTVELLIRPNYMSSIHYLNSIIYSKDKYAKAITGAELDLTSC